jgi:hypothetical protein
MSNDYIPFKNSGSIQTTNDINYNFTLIKDAINGSISRTNPNNNSMQNDLNLNGNKILNYNYTFNANQIELTLKTYVNDKDNQLFSTIKSLIDVHATEQELTSIINERVLSDNKLISEIQPLENFLLTYTTKTSIGVLEQADDTEIDGEIVDDRFLSPFGFNRMLSNQPVVSGFSSGDVKMMNKGDVENSDEWLQQDGSPFDGVAYPALASLEGYTSDPIEGGITGFINPNKYLTTPTGLFGHMHSIKVNDFLSYGIFTEYSGASQIYKSIDNWKTSNFLINMPFEHINGALGSAGWDFDDTIMFTCGGTCALFSISTESFITPKITFGSSGMLYCYFNHFNLNLGEWVAFVADVGTTVQILKSTDGINWISQSSSYDFGGRILSNKANCDCYYDGFYYFNSKGKQQIHKVSENNLTNSFDPSTVALSYNRAATSTAPDNVKVAVSDSGVLVTVIGCNTSTNQQELICSKDQLDSFQIKTTQPSGDISNRYTSLASISGESFWLGTDNADYFYLTTDAFDSPAYNGGTSFADADGFAGGPSSAHLDNANNRLAIFIANGWGTTGAKSYIQEFDILKNEPEPGGYKTIDMNDLVIGNLVPAVKATI